MPLLALFLEVMSQEESSSVSKTLSPFYSDVASLLLSHVLVYQSLSIFLYIGFYGNFGVKVFIFKMANGDGSNDTGSKLDDFI